MKTTLITKPAIKQFCPLIVLLLLLMAQVGHAQQKNGTEKYHVNNRQLTVNADGSVRLSVLDQGRGVAWMNGKTFKYGVIEFDLKGKDEFQASFLGIAFHGADDTTYEAVYFRPFNFRTADTLRKKHAVQYIVLPKYDYDDLRKLYPEKFESGVSPVPDPNGWFHVRLLVEPEQISVFINGSDKPSLSIKPLVSARGSRIGYWTGGLDCDFKNLKVSNR